MPETDTLPIRTSRRRRRWYRAQRVLSVGVGVLAVGAAVSLGVNAPTSSPVQTAVAAPAPATADGAAAQVVPADPSGGTRFGDGDGGGRGGGTHAVRFGGHHR